MVATERRMRAETEEELRELKQEKEALRSALRLIDGEIRGRPDLSLSEEKQIAEMIASFSPSHSRSSSRMAVKSRPTSLDLYSTLPPLPPSPTSVSRTSSFDESNFPSLINAPPALSPEEEESQPTPRFPRSMLQTPEPQNDMLMGPSPWADVASHPASELRYSTTAYTISR